MLPGQPHLREVIDRHTLWKIDVVRRLVGAKDADGDPWLSRIRIDQEKIQVYVDRGGYAGWWKAMWIDLARLADGEPEALVFARWNISKRAESIRAPEESVHAA